MADRDIVDDELQHRVSMLQDKQDRQAICMHQGGWAYVANRPGAQVWRRCERCGANVDGAGIWIPTGYLRRRGIDPRTLPVLDEGSAHR